LTRDRRKGKWEIFRVRNINIVNDNGFYPSVYRSVAIFPDFTIPFYQLRRWTSLLNSVVLGRGRRAEEKRRTIERGDQPRAQLTLLTENSWQTSGRLDETAERHETEGKRKWQSLSEGASTTLRSSKPLARKWYRGRVHHQ